MTRKRPRSHANLPASAPVFPLTGALLLPRTHRPLNVFEPRFLDLVDAALAGPRLVVLSQPLDISEESPKGDVELQQIGALGWLTHFEQADDERYLIVLEGLSRVRLGAEVGTDAPYRRFRFSANEFASDFSAPAVHTTIDRKRLETTLRAYAEFAEFDLDWEEIDKTGDVELVDLCCMLGPFGPRESQVLLEAQSTEIRAETLIALAELEMARSRSGATLQ